MPVTVTAKGPLKVVAVIEPAELLDVPEPDGQPRMVLTIRLPQGTVTADLAAKSVRRAIARVREHGAENVAAIVQGWLVGDQITDAGVVVQPKVPKPERTAASDARHQEDARTVSGVAGADIESWRPIATSAAGRISRRSSEDLRLIRAIIQDDAELTQRLQDVLEARIPLSEALPKAKFDLLHSPPVLSVPQPLRATARHTFRAANARRILNCISKTFVVPDHRRDKAAEWFIRALEQDLDASADQRTAA